jgi:hypothetical protein
MTAIFTRRVRRLLVLLMLLFPIGFRILITIRSQPQSRGNYRAPAQQVAARRDRWLGCFMANRYRVITHRCIPRMSQHGCGDGLRWRGRPSATLLTTLGSRHYLAVNNRDPFMGQKDASPVSIPGRRS